MTLLAYADRPAPRPAGTKRTQSLRRLMAGGFALVFITASGVASAASLPPDSFADLAAKVTPAVVNISSIHHVASEETDVPFDFPPGSPFEQFFKQFRNRQGRQHGGEDMKALGSGFIVDPSGYIVTNDHVIDDATDIQVTLNNGKYFPAKVIGVDKKTDLA